MVKNISDVEKEELLSIKAVFFDFDGVFTDNHVYITEDGEESVRSLRSDGLGIARLKEINIKTKIISTETNEVVLKRAQKLNIDCSYGVQDKASEITTYCSKNKIDLKDVIFIGNDINDIPALKLVGIPIGVSDSYPEIIPYLRYQTSKAGGHGAVREICDIIFNTFIELRDKI